MRSLKVSEISRLSEVWGKYRTAPYIRLQGLWLERLGFNIGNKVTVEERFGELIIKIQDKVGLIEEGHPP